MVKGLTRFRDYFADYKDCYVLIGGVALWLVMDDAGLEPRGTRDLDIVLCIEALDSGFGTLFWQFINEGGYQIQEKSSGEKTFYRFSKPSEPDYPDMLELFSRNPDEMVLGDDSHLTPIPVAEDVSSLSAILLDDDYYEFLHANVTELGGVPVIDEGCLIPFKAKAWLDMTDRKAAGAQVDSKDIKKHRSDVLRLYQVLNPENSIPLPETIANELSSFLNRVQPEIDGNVLKGIGIKGVGPEEVLGTISSVFGVAITGSEE